MARKFDGLIKKDLETILVEEYGYDKEDLKENGRPITNAKLIAMIEQEDKDAKELTEPKEELSELDKEVTTVTNTHRFKDDDLVVVMNGLNGALVHRSESTGRVWRFTEFGQTEKIPYGELLSIRNQSSKVFNEGWMIILNRQIQEEFGLTELYKNIITPQTIDSVFDKDVDELEEFIDAMPNGAKSAFIGRARQLYESRELDSMMKIELIQNKFGFSLEDNAPLSDIAVKAKE